MPARLGSILGSAGPGSMAPPDLCAVGEGRKLMEAQTRREATALLRCEMRHLILHAFVLPLG